MAAGMPAANAAGFAARVEAAAVEGAYAPVAICADSQPSIAFLRAGPAP